MFSRNSLATRDQEPYRYARTADGREIWTPRSPRASVDNGPKKMAAKYAGVCNACSARFEVGTAILWGRGQGARHEVCPAREVASAARSAEIARDDNADEIAMALAEMAADREGTMKDNKANLAAEIADEADALLDEYDAITADEMEAVLTEQYEASRRAANVQTLLARKLIYRVKLDGDESKRYGEDIINIQIVPNARYGNAKISEFKAGSIGTINPGGKIRYWNDVDPNAANTKLIIAALDVLLAAAEPEAMAKAYAIEAQECARCGDTLVDDGNPYFPYFGPVCGKKFAAGE